MSKASVGTDELLYAGPAWTANPLAPDDHSMVLRAGTYTDAIRLHVDVAFSLEEPMWQVAPHDPELNLRIGGPLLDRIDLHVDVPSVEYKELTTGASGDSSAVIRERVERCRSVQTDRFKKDNGVSTNSTMTPRLIKKHCELDAEGGQFLEHHMGEMNFSARAHDRILKVARTLADLGGQDKISADNVMEAVQYRTLDRKLWV